MASPYDMICIDMYSTYVHMTKSCAYLRLHTLRTSPFACAPYDILLSTLDAKMGMLRWPGDGLFLELFSSIIFKLMGHHFELFVTVVFGGSPGAVGTAIFEAV